jgi:zinc transport system permease protein
VPEILTHAFVQHALAAALLASVACGVIGTLVVVNRLVFMAGGMAHSAYGGVGLAFYAGLPVTACTLGFTFAAALLMGWATRRDQTGADTFVGVLWAGGMALGVLLLDLSPGYNVDLMSYLFGSILTVSTGDLWVMAGLDAAILVLTGVFYKDLMLLSFDPEFAEASGVRVGAVRLLLLVMVAMSVVMIIRVVGLILVIALLTIPPRLSRGRSSLSAMMLAAGLWSLAFCLVGLGLAYALDLTSGASIIAVAVAGFFLVSVGRLVSARILPA